MKSALILSLLCVSLATCQSNDPGQQKLKKMEALEYASGTGIIVFNAKNYDELVLQNPRPYDVVVLYTVSAHCDLCDEVFGEYETVVYSFQKNKNLQQRPVFFGALYHSKDTQQFFLQHAFKTVPHLTISLQKPKRQEGEEFYKEEDKWNVRADEIYDSNKILEFFNKRLSLNIPLTFPLSTVLLKNVTFFLIFGAVLTILKYLRVIMLEPVVWFIIAMLTYFICTGGIVYSIIHNVPWFKMERDQFGNVVIAEYFMKGQRGQWAGEGYIFSVLVCLTGFTLIFLSKVEDILKKNSHRRIAVLTCLALIYFLTEMMLICYKYKSPWYGPGFSPPGHYQRGPLMADQGNNI